MRPRKFKLLVIVLIAFCACTKNKGTVPANTVLKPTIDFREDYTGYFIVDIISQHGYNRDLQYSDTFRQIKIHFSYSVGDTVFYYTQGKITSRFPALNMVIIDSAKIKPKNTVKNHTWGITDNVTGQLNFSNNNSSGVANIVQNIGGFAGRDSINFTYHYSDPHIWDAYLIWGSRIK